MLFCLFLGLLDVVEKHETPERTDTGAELLYGSFVFLILINLDHTVFSPEIQISVSILRPECFRMVNKALKDRKEYIKCCEKQLYCKTILSRLQKLGHLY